MPSRHEQTIRAHFDAWNARDREGMVRDLTEDVVVEEDSGFQPAPGVHRGHDACFALWDQLFEVSDDARVDVLEVDDVGDDRVLVLMKLTATLRQSGITGTYDMAHIWHMRGGKVHRAQVFGSHDDARAAALAGS